MKEGNWVICERDGDDVERGPGYARLTRYSVKSGSWVICQ